MSASVPDDSTASASSDPTPELAGLDPKELLQAGLETQPVPPPADAGAEAEATTFVPPPQSSQPTVPQGGLPLPLPEELTQMLPGGHYHVSGFLGQGGMGAVYKGTQVRLKRPVAIKIMRRDLGKDFDFEARFEREAQAMAKLNHPNIVSVIDYGEAGPDYLYIVMELVDGADLMDVIRGGQMTQEMAFTLLPQICDALQFAHDHGIVHRDIKPSNIMLTRDGRIKMADFGLAKHFDADSSFRTQSGTGMGTPDYAAPEQFDPTTAIDHRADIYALGVMIYQMITGQLPRGVWKPPSQRAAVAPQWDEIVSRAMQSDPSDRYQQASQVKTDVSSISLAQAAAAGPPATAQVHAQVARSGKQADADANRPRSAATTSRRRAPFAALAAGVVIALGAFLFYQKSVQPGTAPGSPGSTHPAGAPASRTAAAGSPAAATKEAPFVNSLGMKFVPVPITGGPTDGKRVLFSIWETRVRDYEVFVAEQKVEWRERPFEQGPDHPAVGGNARNAGAFCEWLTKREQAQGGLDGALAYRLPSDHEWSCAAGIGSKEDASASPRDKSGVVPDYLWGDKLSTQWPPPAGVANLSGQESAAQRRVIEGWQDPYVFTAPVGSFPPNALGLYDLAGNASEWCADSWAPDDARQVERAVCFETFYYQTAALSKRNCQGSDTRGHNLGFRVVLGPATPAP